MLLISSILKLLKKIEVTGVVRVKNEWKNAKGNKIGMMFAWKKKKGKTSKFVEAESKNWNEEVGN